MLPGPEARSGAAHRRLHLDSHRGRAAVYLDGRGPIMVDLYATTLKGAKLSKALPSGTHTIVIKVSGQKNASSTDYNLYNDAFEVVP